MSDHISKSELIGRLAEAQVYDPDRHSITLEHTCPGCGAGAVLNHRDPRTSRRFCNSCSEMMKHIKNPNAAVALEACRKKGRVESTDGIYAMGVLGVSDEDGPYTVAVEIQDGVIVDVLPVDVLDADAELKGQQ